METKLAFHKDTELFIREYQKTLDNKNVIPVYPFYVSIKKEIDFSSITKLTITTPVISDNKIVIPINLFFNEDKITLNLEIAKIICLKKISFKEIYREERIFRLIDLNQTETQWEIYKEKWIKLR